MKVLNLYSGIGGNRKLLYSLHTRKVYEYSKRRRFEMFTFDEKLDELLKEEVTVWKSKKLVGK